MCPSQSCPVELGPEIVSTSAHTSDWLIFLHTCGDHRAVQEEVSCTHHGCKYAEYSAQHHRLSPQTSRTMVATWPACCHPCLDHRGGLCYAGLCVAQLRHHCWEGLAGRRPLSELKTPRPPPALSHHPLRCTEISQVSQVSHLP